MIYITNTDRRKKGKFWIIFLKLINHTVFGTLENILKHQDIKLSIIKRRRKSLILEPNYNTKCFSEYLLA